MKTICAWCNTIMVEDPDATPETTSHGICSSCRATIKALHKKSKHYTLHELLQSLNIPLIILNKDTTINNATPSMLQSLQLTPDQIKGQFGGDLMACIYAALPGGCGKTIHCPACTIRNTVEHTFKTGEPGIGIRAKLQQRTDQGIQTNYFLISTVKIDQYVFLKIEPIVL